MPGTIPSNLQTHLDGDYQTLALCVKVTRQDGTVMGFTSHDKDLTISAVTYEASSALDASAFSKKMGTSVDNLEFITVHTRYPGKPQLSTSNGYRLSQPSLATTA